MVLARRRWHAVAAFCSLAIVGLAACGRAGDGSGDTQALPVEQPRAVAPEASSPEGESAIPDVSVLDVRSGDEFALASIAPADRAVLVWFWAPLGPFCRREAPGVEQFARTHGDVVKVVDLGAQDTFEEAEEFLDRYGTKSFPMLWDPELESWRQLGVTGTPTFALFDRQGRPVDAWVGLFDEGRVLDRARKA